MFPIQISQIFNTYPWTKNLGSIAIFYLLAWIFSYLSRWIIKSIFRPKSGSARKRQLSPERKKTLQGLVSNAFSFLGFLAATLASIGLFVQTDTLVWMVGLFSAAFGLGARPLISDFLAGLGFIFDDTFSVGEKVEILDMEGVIEAISLRNTLMRSSTGELYTIPNGEIRTVRNFSRGRFSIAEVSFNVAVDDLVQTLEVLQTLGKEAVLILPNLVEPWRILSESGIIGQNTKLTIIAKARYGKAAEMRPKLLAFIHENLKDASIQIAE